MSSSPSSRLTLVLVATLLLVAGSASAVSVTEESPPAETLVGDRIESSYRLTELYDDYDQWTLQANTELRNVTWTFRLLDQSGDPIGDAVEQDGQEASTAVSIDEGVAEVEVRVVGEVPAIENFSYEPPSSFLLASFELRREGGTSSAIESHEVRHYTAESQEARQAIGAARTAIEAAGGNAEAEEILDNAVSAYEGRNFENAVSLAEQSERRAVQARQTQQRNQLIIYGAVGLIAVLIVVAVVSWLLNRDTGGRL